MRQKKHFNSLHIPKALQKALPFRNKPKTQAKASKVPKDRLRPAVIREPQERKVCQWWLPELHSDVKIVLSAAPLAFLLPSQSSTGKDKARLRALELEVRGKARVRPFLSSHLVTLCLEHLTGEEQALSWWVPLS